MPDRPTNATTIIQIAWPTGMMTLRCAGIPPVTDSASVEIQRVMQQFSADSQMMLVWFSAVLGSQQAMRSHLARVADHGEPFTINSYRPDGRPESVRASVPVEDVVAALEDAGRFERLYARPFVVFVYQTWEHAIRPSMAAALEVADVKDIKSDLMGELRHLRNWLVHPIPDSDAETDFFDKAPVLRHALGMKRGATSLTAAGVGVLMRCLNDMQVDVAPNGATFDIEVEPVDIARWAGVARSVPPDNCFVFPEIHMRPFAGAWIVFDDGPTATVHDRQCEQAESQYRQLVGGRKVQMPSLDVARAVLAELGKSEGPCEHCAASWGSAPDLADYSIADGIARQVRASDRAKEP